MYFFLSSGVYSSLNQRQTSHNLVDTAEHEQYFFGMRWVGEKSALPKERHVFHTFVSKTFIKL